MNAHEQVVNKQVVHLMKTLGCSEAEAIQIIKDDEAIEAGEKLFEQTPEQKKATKAMTSAGGGKHKEKAKREPKMDADKHYLMDCVENALHNCFKTYTGRLGDAEITFTYNNAEYTIKLVKHRKPKEGK